MLNYIKDKRHGIETKLFYKGKIPYRPMKPD